MACTGSVKLNMKWFSRTARDPLIALSAGQFGMSVMHTLFMFYYVKVYLHIFDISEWYFALAQGLYLVWNAVNDPLFGYVQDSSPTWLSCRRTVMRRLAPGMAFSFVLIWRWMPYQQGIHLILTLFLYDAFFSAIGVAWSAMFAEMEGGAVARAAAMKYSQMAILCSVNIIPITEKISDSLENFHSFQVMSLVTAVLGLGCMLLCSQSHFAKKLSIPHSVEKREDMLYLLNDKMEIEEDRSDVEIMKSARQLLCRRDLLSIIFVNFVHNARSAMHLNFASITTEVLIPSNILPKGSISLAAFYALCTLMPQVIAIMSEGLVVRMGAHALAQASFAATAVVSAVLYSVGSSPYIVMIYMFLDSVAVHSIAPLFNILISEFIEDDQRRHQRRKPLSSLVFGVNSLFVKPAQSIAPLVVVHYLNSHGYEEYKASHVPSTSLVESTNSLLFIPPLVMGVVQWIAFRSYSLAERNRHAPTHNL